MLIMRAILPTIFFGIVTFITKNTATAADQLPLTIQNSSSIPLQNDTIFPPTVSTGYEYTASEYAAYENYEYTAPAPTTAAPSTRKPTTGMPSKKPTTDKPTTARPTDNMKPTAKPHKTPTIKPTGKILTFSPTMLTTKRPSIKPTIHHTTEQHDRRRLKLG